MNSINGAALEGGSKTFINKGIYDRCKEILTKEDNKRYVQIAAAQLGEQAARWPRPKNNLLQ